MFSGILSSIVSVAQNIHLPLHLSSDRFHADPSSSESQTVLFIVSLLWNHEAALASGWDENSTLMYLKEFVYTGLWEIYGTIYFSLVS